MAQAIPQPVTFAEFIEGYPDKGERRYELHGGVTTHWRDDYYFKFADYEALGIPEYWIADDAALGGRKFIGNPKQPTLSVCKLVDGEYQVELFR